MRSTTAVRLRVRSSDQPRASILVKLCGQLEDKKTQSRNKRLSPPAEFPAAAVSWNIIAAAGKFCREPGISNLVEVLNLLAAEQESGTRRAEIMWRRYPWPLAECALACQNGTAAELADFVQSGGFGDYADWITREREWLETGLSLDQLASSRSLFSLQDGETLYELPYRVTSLDDVNPHNPTHSANEISEFSQAFSASSAPQARRLLGLHIISAVVIGFGRRANVELPREIVSCLDDAVRIMQNLGYR